MAADQTSDFFPAESALAPKPSRKTRRSTPESRYWRSFRNSHLSSGLLHAVTHLEFNPASPHDLAAAVSASVHLYDGHSDDLSPKAFSPLNFPDIAYSPSFRFDGALLAAGCENGIVQLVDPNKNRPVLRRLKGHTRASRVVRYPRFADKTHLFSGGDDAVLNYWDAAGESLLSSFPAAHKDYIRAGAASPESPEVFATGSYDHTVKLWDVRVGPQGASVLGLSHGSPVECVLFLPSGGLIATAGGNSVKIWDVIGGGRMIHSMESHNKTVTSLCIGKLGNKDDGSLGGESRIFSVSIDGYLKVFDYSSFKVTHSTRYPNMLLSVASSPNGLVRVAGTSNGVIYVGKKEAKDNNTAETVREKRALRPSYYRYFHRGQNEKPSEGDYLVKKPKKFKLAEHDKCLKKFLHKEALVSALNTRNPKTVVAVMEELIARRKLLRCVENLEEDEFNLLLAFLNKYTTMPQYARLLIGLSKKVIELRSEDIHNSQQSKLHVRNLKGMIDEEIKLQSSLQELKGMLFPLLKMAAR